MVEKCFMVLDDIYVDYFWVIFLGGIFFLLEVNWRENGVDSGLERVEEIGLFVFLVGELKIFKNGKKNR